MKIFSPAHTQLYDIQVDDRSVRYRSIMNDDSLTLHFSTPGTITISVGSYVDFEGQRYTLFYPENFKKHNTRNFEYTLVLHGNRELLKRFKFKDTAAIPYRLKFSLTAKPVDFITRLIQNMNLHDSGWAVGDCVDAPEKLISFNHESCFDVLGRLAQEFNTEWEIAGKTIHLRKVEKFKTTPLALSYGKGNGFKSGTGRMNDGDKIPVGRLYVQGGERNIDLSTYGSASLLLPKSATLEYEGKTYRTDAEGMSITRDGNTNIGEESYDGSDIYPKWTGIVSEVIAVDSSKNFYDIKDYTIPYSLNFRDCRIPGEKATIVFQSGILAGREFDIEQTEDELTGYIHAERRFKIVPQEQDGQVMPGGAFIPAVGDKYAVFNIRMPQAYISVDATKKGASWDLFREAVKYFAENETQKFQFTGELDGVWSKSRWLQIGGKIVPGGHVLFSDPQFLHGGEVIRIVSVKDYVNSPHKPEITLSNAPVSGSFASGLAKLEAEEVVIEQNRRDMIRFAQRQWRDTKETQAMLEQSLLNFSGSINPVTIKTMQLIAGDESLQFRFVNSKTTPVRVDHNITFNPSTKVLTAAAGIIQHMTLGITELTTANRPKTYKFWDIDNPDGYTSPPLTNPDKAYYLYAECSKTGTTGTYLLSVTSIGMESVSGFYHFLIGILNSEQGGDRSFAPVYGFTEILPGRITADRIVSQDGNTFFDLLNGIIGGKISFTAGSSGLANLSEWDAAAQSIQDAQNTANQAAIDAGNAMQEAMNNVTDYNTKFATVQQQIDGEVSNWFYAYSPTLSNYPANSWAGSVEKDRHIGDTFTNIQPAPAADAGKSWRFIKNDSVYSWTPIADSDAVKALQQAAAAQSTADGKSTTYLIQPVKYSYGDTWVLGSAWNGFKAGDILTATQSSVTFVSAHWIKRVRYTDDAMANEAKQLAIDTQNNLNSTNETVNALESEWGSITKDGVISEAEAKAIEIYKNIINTEKVGLEAQYNKLYTNSYLSGTAKSNLLNAKISYLGAVDNLLLAINTAIADGAPTPAEKALVDTRFSQYRTALASFQSAVEDANKAIQDAIKAIADGAATAASDAQNTANQAAIDAENALQEAMNNVTDYNAKFATIQQQVDGEVNNWFYAYTPTPSNYPASEWTTNEIRDRHIGDTFTNTQAYVDAASTPDAGKSWRYVKNSGVYSWTIIADSDAVKALLEAATAKSTADGKSTTYLIQPSKYSLGDAWVLAADATINGVAYKAGDILTATQSSEVYNAAHWVKKVRYTDDTAANAAQAAASNAQTAANTANSLLADIAADDRLTPSDKQAAQKEWDIILSEKAKIDAHADIYGVSKSAYGTAFTNLSNYITPLLASLTTTSNIVGATFRLIFKAYYDARQDLLNAAAEAAKTYSNNLIANLYVGGENMIIGSKRTLTAGENNYEYSVLYGYETGTAAAAMSSIAGDNTLTAQEKTVLKNEWENIQYQKPRIEAIADSRKVSKTTYGAAFANLSGYITPLLADMNSSSSVSASTFNSLFTSYYSARQALLVAAGAYLTNGKTYVLSVGSVVKISGTATKIRALLYDFVNLTAQVVTDDMNVSASRQVYTFTVPATGYYSLIIYAGMSGSTSGNIIAFDQLMLQEGNKASAFTPAVRHVSDALDGSTDIIGGLVATNLLMMKDPDGNIRGGMSGLTDNIGFWTGGTYAEALSMLAKIILRKDGSGQLAGGKINWTKDGDAGIGVLEVGAEGIVRVKDAADSSLVRLLIHKKPLGTVASFLDDASTSNSINLPGYYRTNAGGSLEFSETLYVTKNDSTLTYAAYMVLDVVRDLLPEPGQTFVFKTEALIVLLKKNESSGLFEPYMALAREETTSHLNTTVQKIYNNLATGEYRIMIEHSISPDGGVSIWGQSLSFVHNNLIRRVEFGKDGFAMLYNVGGVKNYFHMTESGGLVVGGKMDIPGVLLAGDGYSGGSGVIRFGVKKHANLIVEKLSGNGYYRVHHSIGHNEYTVQLTLKTGGLIAMWENNQSTYFDVKLYSGVTLTNGNFSFAIYGRN